MLDPNNVARLLRVDGNRKRGMEPTLQVSDSAPQIEDCYIPTDEELEALVTYHEAVLQGNLKEYA